MAEAESPYTPPGAELVGGDGLQDGETWTYPLRFSATLGFFPRRELRDARQRLLWLAELKPVQAGITLQTQRGGEVLALEARLASVWRQRWELRDSETKEPLAALARLGGCFPGAFRLSPAWAAEGDEGLRPRAAREGARDRALGARAPSRRLPWLAAGRQDPTGLRVETPGRSKRSARLTLTKAKESRPTQRAQAEGTFSAT